MARRLQLRQQESSMVSAVNPITAYPVQKGRTVSIASAAPGEGFASEMAQLQGVSAPVPLVAPKSAAQAEAATPAKEPEPKIARSWRMAGAEKATEVAYEDSDFGFEDVVDLLNPLQHIPIVGTIYRAVTGDTIKPEVQVAGSIAYGAVTGSLLLSAAAGVASAIFEQDTGKEPTIQLAEALFGGGKAAPKDAEKAPAPIMVAEAKEAPLSEPVPAAPVEKATASTAENVKMAQADPEKTLPLWGAVGGGTRVGNVIYTSPTMRSAAKVPPTPAVRASAVPQAPAAKLDGTTLGAMLQGQAATRQAGNSLPPELVQDMMLMALDKYKAAHGATAGANLP